MNNFIQKLLCKKNSVPLSPAGTFPVQSERQVFVKRCFKQFLGRIFEYDLGDGEKTGLLLKTDYYDGAQGGHIEFTVVTSDEVIIESVEMTKIENIKFNKL